jgi:hypothetical protein
MDEKIQQSIFNFHLHIEMRASRNMNKQTLAFDDKIKDAIIQAAVAELMRLEDSNNGRLPHKAMVTVIEGIQKRGYEVGQNLLNHMKKSAHEHLKPLSEIEFDSDNMCISNASGITSSTTSSDKRQRGRPIGSSLISKKEQLDLRAECINDITRCYALELQRKKEANNNYNIKITRTDNGFLDNLIKKKWEEHGIAHSLSSAEFVSAETIRTQVKNGISIQPCH